AIAPIFPTAAQITPDNTLGTERSRLDSNVLINNVLGDKINGGAIRDRNLFHSFSEFNINDGQRVYFSNPSGVLNILTRVTGGNASSILGTLGVDGIANLFLINPNGILFGKNGSLDVRGSFVGTTANGLQFGNQGVFSATNPQAVPLLTVNPSALTFSQIQANAGITNQSQVPAGINPDGNPATGLRVPDGKSLLLVGGNINSDGGRFRAYDGRVELMGLTAPGSIGLNVAGDNLSLNIFNDVTFADVFLGNVSVISVFGAKGGEIVINARNIDINNSYLFAGISAGKGTATTQARDINLNSTGNITLTNSAAIGNSVSGSGNVGNIFVQAKGAVTLESGDIFSTVEAGAVGNGGDINIQADSLTLTESAQLLTSIRAGENNLPAGKGNAGDLNINVRGAVTFANPLPGIANGIFADVETGAVGNAGNVVINAGSFDVRDGSEIQTSTSGIGNAGNITINARDIRFDGREGNQGVFSRVFAAVLAGGEGNAGNINVTTENLKLTNGAFISNNIYGTGNAGNIRITARDINLDTWSKVDSNIAPEGVGNGGEISINTNTIFLTNGSYIYSSILGRGNAGNIMIDAKDSIAIDGVLVDGNQLFGISPDLFIASSIGSDLLNIGVGKAGDISITTPFLSLTNGGEVTSRGGGQGNSGNITINTRDKVIIDGFKGKDFLNSQISNAVTGNGNGGDIRINTGDLVVKNSGDINAINTGVGNAGNIFLDVRNTIAFDGFANNSLSNVSTTARNGNAGNLEVNTGSLFLTNGGYISSIFLGSKGNAGNIIINARDTVRINAFAQGLISDDGNTRQSPSIVSSSLLQGEGKGGDITITTGSLFVTKGAAITANTSTKGNAGNITIDARDKIIFDSAFDDSLTGNSVTFISNSASSNSTGNAGNIRINTKEFLLTNGAFLTSFSSGTGNGGNISVKTDTFSVTGGANLSSFAKTTAGNINIEAIDGVAIDGVNSSDNNSSGLYSFLSSGGTTPGKGGDIDISAGSLSMTNGGQINATTSGNGNSGNIRIKITGDIALRNNSQILASTFAQGDAGEITINTGGKLFLEGVTVNGLKFDTGIFTTVEKDGELIGKGKGGNINVTSRDLSLNRATISASSFGEGTGGNLDIKAGTVKLDNKSAIDLSPIPVMVVIST
ncbi:MAG: filamentous hemagglutinin N-terminal domain-containing protein, partial [Calothrix sp. CSU_2_0]|nr:filamentous hemagglutinin N-terminal domain-containing protein [Calothrix sp. CSU_2_0]